MKYEDIELNWSMTEDIMDEDDGEGLDEVELERLAYLAEHPELADPVMCYLRKARRTRGRRCFASLLFLLTLEFLFPQGRKRNSTHVEFRR